MTIAMIRKSTVTWMKLPQLSVTAGLITAPLASVTASFIVHLRSLKLRPPMSRPIGGITTSDTNDVTIFPNAPPMITPTAMSITLPLRANILNSLSSFMLHVFKRYSFNVAKLQKLSVYLHFDFRERCSSGLRGTPGKRVYDKIVSRVRIPISPQETLKINVLQNKHPILHPRM